MCLQHHHDNEELIVIPELVKLGVVMPAKMSADHPGLMRAVEDLTAQLRALKPGQPAETDLATLTRLYESFEALHSEMCEHLQEEEDVALPLLRHHLTHKQWKPVEDKIVKSLSLASTGKNFPKQAARSWHRACSAREAHSWQTDTSMLVHRAPCSHVLSTWADSHL